MDRYVVVSLKEIRQDTGDFLARQRSICGALRPQLLRINVTNTSADDAPPLTAVTTKPVEGITELGFDGGFTLDPQWFPGDWVYRVDSHDQLSRARTWEHGMASPGVKLVFAVRRSAPTAEQFRKYWLQQHVPLALRHHVGMCAYRTDVVLDAAGAAPPIDGFSHLLFPSEIDYRNRLFDSDSGRQAIEHDVARFVAEADPWRVDEYLEIDADE
jgi:uncharacterized protein (TIGR02118 family)